MTETKDYNNDNRGGDFINDGVTSSPNKRQSSRTSTSVKKPPLTTKLQPKK